MDFSSYKTWERIIIAGIAVIAILYFCISSCDSTSSSSNKSFQKEEQLIERGKEYILRQVNSPSTTTFLTTTPMDKTEALLKEWGVHLEEKHDALMIGFEATNLYGGRVRKNWCIFYVNGYPIDYADGENINRANVHQYISIMRENGW